MTWIGSVAAWRASFPGADAATVAQSVAAPIEEQINGVENMISMKSTSGGDGSYSLSILFKVGTNPQDHTVNVNNRINRAMPQMPVSLVGAPVLTAGALVLMALVVPTILAVWMQGFDAFMANPSGTGP